MHKHRTKTHSQIEFNDPGAGQYRSLYLGTLGAEARCKPRPHSAAPGSTSDHAVEGYVHGTLSTAGIAGASPAVYSITRRTAKQRDRLVADGSTPYTAADQIAAAASATPAVICLPLEETEASDLGMRPKVRIPCHVNKPNFIHSTLDIEGAQPVDHSVPKHPRNTNPLSPHYKLPSGAVCLPSGPASADRLLCDPLKVADIPGATRTPRRARSASAPRQLDVRDIEGASSSWKPTHRQHSNLQPHNFILDVSDINTYMASFKAGPRLTADKGHPEGPKVPSQVKPRQNTCEMDNSLRTLDIEGSRCVPAQHQTCAPRPWNICVCDIAGAAPAAREKTRLFESRKAAAAAAVADRTAGQAVLSGLVLQPAALAAVWNKCSKMDKDNSGLLTAAELECSLKSAQIHLTPADTQRLLAALRDNAGLLNYKKLTKHLKGCISRPDSAQQQPKEQHNLAVAEPITAAAPAAAAEAETQPIEFSKCVLMLQQGQLPGTSNTGSSNSATQRSRPGTAPATSQQLGLQGLSRPGVRAGDNHWFAGTGHDEASTAELGAWSPTLALKHTLENAVLLQPEVQPYQADSAAAATNTGKSDRVAGDAAAEIGPTSTGCRGKGRDIVPGWVIGADLVHGTFKVVQPFSHAGAAVFPDAAAGAQATSGCMESPGLPAGGRQAESASDIQSNNGSSPVSMQTVLCRAEPDGSCSCNSEGSRHTRPASACFSSSSSIVACDLGLTVASTHVRSSTGRSDLFGVTANVNDAAHAVAQSRQKQQQRPRSAAAALQLGINRSSEKSTSTCKDGIVIGSVAAARQSSIRTLGLADQRRLHEGMQQDLAAVRLLQ